MQRGSRAAKHGDTEARKGIFCFSSLCLCAFVVRPSYSLSWLILLLSFAAVLRAQSQIDANFPREDCQPTQAVAGWHYAGSKACAACHATEFATQPATDMAQALRPVADCQILQSHPRLGVKLGQDAYLIATQGGVSEYTVSDGTRSVSEPLVWAFGQGGHDSPSALSPAVEPPLRGRRSARQLSGVP